MIRSYRANKHVYIHTYNSPCNCNMTTSSWTLLGTRGAVFFPCCTRNYDVIITLRPKTLKLWEATSFWSCSYAQLQRGNVELRGQCMLEKRGGLRIVLIDLNVCSAPVCHQCLLRRGVKHRDASLLRPDVL